MRKNSYFFPVPLCVRDFYWRLSCCLRKGKWGSFPIFRQIFVQQACCDIAPFRGLTRVILRQLRSCLNPFFMTNKTSLSARQKVVIKECVMGWSEINSLTAGDTVLAIVLRRCKMKKTNTGRSEKWKNVLAFFIICPLFVCDWGEFPFVNLVFDWSVVEFSNCLAAPCFFALFWGASSFRFLNPNPCFECQLLSVYLPSLVRSFRWGSY